MDAQDEHQIMITFSQKQAGIIDRFEQLLRRTGATTGQIEAARQGRRVQVTPRQVYSGAVYSDPELVE